MIKTGTTVEINIDVPRDLAKIEDPTFQLFAAETWYKLYRDYVPNDTGTLYKTVRIRPNEIEHVAPYARTVYEHNRHYRRDKAPKATAHWSEAAEPAEKPKLIRTLQNYIDSGRLHLDR